MAKAISQRPGGKLRGVIIAIRPAARQDRRGLNPETLLAVKYGSVKAAAAHVTWPDIIGPRGIGRNW